MLWFDAHLDLAYLAVNGRDMLAPLDVSALPHPPAAVTLPSLAEGGVRFALATIFTEPDGRDAEAYPVGDAQRAFTTGRTQLEVYLTWKERGLALIDLPGALRIDSGVGEVRGGMGVAQLITEPPASRAQRIAGSGGRSARTGPHGPLHIGILMENADPIRSPEDLGWWKQRGVCAVGLAWAKPSRYAGGNTTDLGLTDLGRALVREMDRLGVIHDASHLSDRAFRELCDLTDRPIIASHSNSRAILGDDANQRHLTDDQIREITRRGGLIGLNLYSKFLIPTAPGRRPDRDRATVLEALAHIDRICDLAGSRACIGLGSDMDGGFAADRLPEGIDLPRDLFRLAEALSAGGWSDEEIGGFAFGNWARFWSGAR
ncbi:MAG: dipeptidase [Phycisphaerales bacterium]